jgi:hypothetical protein
MRMNNAMAYLIEDFLSNKSPKLCQKCGAQWNQSQPQLYNLFVCFSKEHFIGNWKDVLNLWTDTK